MACIENIRTVSQSEGLGQTTNTTKDYEKASGGVPLRYQRDFTMGRGMLLHQRDDADADKGYS